MLISPMLNSGELLYELYNFILLQQHPRPALQWKYYYFRTYNFVFPNRVLWEPTLIDFITIFSLNISVCSSS